jgi:hypothetical protein
MARSSGRILCRLGEDHRIVVGDSFARVGLQQPEVWIPACPGLGLYNNNIERLALTTNTFVQHMLASMSRSLRVMFLSS